MRKGEEVLKHIGKSAESYEGKLKAKKVYSELIQCFTVLARLLIQCFTVLARLLIQCLAVLSKPY